MKKMLLLLMLLFVYFSISVSAKAEEQLSVIKVEETQVYFPFNATLELLGAKVSEISEMGIFDITYKGKVYEAEILGKVYDRVKELHVKNKKNNEFVRLNPWGGDGLFINLNGNIYLTEETAARLLKEFTMKFIIDEENSLVEFFDLKNQKCFEMTLKTIPKDEDITVTDNAISEWSKADIEDAIDRNLVPVLNQSAYQGAINRLETCQLVSQFLKLYGFKNNEKLKSPFSDTNDYSVMMLHNLGIIDGKTEKEFYPYDLITREETAKILENLYNVVYDKKGVQKSECKYADKTDISDWAVESVANLSSINIFKGDERGNFNPKNNITKEEMIVTLYRLNGGAELNEKEIDFVMNNIERIYGIDLKNHAIILNYNFYIENGDERFFAKACIEEKDIDYISEVLLNNGFSSDDLGYINVESFSDRNWKKYNWWTLDKSDEVLKLYYKYESLTSYDSNEKLVTIVKENQQHYLYISLRY